MKDKSKVRAVRFPGLLQDAKALGVSRGYLFCLLAGRLTSPRSKELARRYLELKRSQKAATVPEIAPAPEPVPDAALDEQKLIADLVASIRAAFAVRDALIRERAAEKLAEEDDRGPTARRSGQL